jgi:SAM-dependent methyltransferase/ribosomal protein S27AE
LHLSATNEIVLAARLCPNCGAAQAIAAGERIWPPDWACAACGASAPAPEGVPLFCPKLADTLTGFDPSGFALLAKAEEHHFWFQSRNRLLLGLLHRYFPRSRSLLEIGCGTGNVLANMLRRGNWDRIAGAELHTSGLRLARSRLPPEVELVQLDATAIPATNVFDVIGAFDVLEHIEQDEAALREMYRAVRPGGGVLIAVPQHPALWSASDEAAYHQRRYRRGELEQKVSAAGFSIVFSSSYLFFLLPLLIVNRLLAGGGRKDRSTIGRELQLAPGINSIFGAITNAEVALTLAGMRWPVGGSRIVVARRLDAHSIAG